MEVMDPVKTHRAFLEHEFTKRAFEWSVHGTCPAEAAEIAMATSTILSILTLVR